MVSLVTIFAILLIIAGYISGRGIYCITEHEYLGALIVLLSVVSLLSFSIMRLSAPTFDCILDCIRNFGYVYLGFVVYFAFFCIFAFIFYFIAQKYGYNFNIQKVLSAGIGCVIVLLLAAYGNAITPRLKEINVPLDNNNNSNNNKQNHKLRLCFVSDIHVGSINSIRILNRVADLINQVKPDVVIFGGDILDMKAVEKYGSEFEAIVQAKITSKYKTYAVIGNHEIYAGAQSCVDCMKRAGISMILDNAIELNGFSVVGRLDKTLVRRKPLQELIQIADTDTAENTGAAKPLIVIDHSPDSIEESAKNGAFLHLSGHTHGGQMFPMNLLVNALYESTGRLKKIGNMFFYITYGAGFWGPPYRIGNIPEVVLVQIRG